MRPKGVCKTLRAVYRTWPRIGSTKKQCHHPDADEAEGGGAQTDWYTWLNRGAEKNALTPALQHTVYVRLGFMAAPLVFDCY
jgi:hypothetical protein